PNEAEVTFEYQGSQIVAIRTPFGEEAHIQRGPGGFIAQIVIRRLQPSGDGVVIHSYRYRHDAEGRIVEFVDPNNVRYEVSYQTDEVMSDQTGRKIYTTTIHNQGDGSFFVRRHEGRESREWIFE